MIAEEIMKSPKYRKELRCVHRHTIEEHPSCFAKGLVKWPNDRIFARFSGEPWWNFPEYRIGYFDIEVDNLNADWGTVLTWCIKEKDGPIKYSVITSSELFNEEYDKRVVQEFVDEMRKYKIFVGYYSTKFDLPYMRAKALHYGIDFPSYGDIFHWDIYYTVKSKLKISSRSLDNTCDYLGINGKTPISKDAWRKAKYGDKESLEEVLNHNKGDVEILEELHDRLDFTRKWIRRSI